MKNERVWLRQMEGLISSIKDLTEAIKPDSFHHRQVPALKRQTEALEYLRKMRATYLDKGNMKPVGLLELIDKVSELLLST